MIKKLDFRKNYKRMLLFEERDISECEKWVCGNLNKAVSIKEEF